MVDHRCIYPPHRHPVPSFPNMKQISLRVSDYPLAYPPSATLIPGALLRSKPTVRSFAPRVPWPASQQTCLKY